MAHFLVSARKYRPQRFGEVKGQKHIVYALQNAIKREQVAQAFLFCGPKGCGKTSCARILAKSINCTHLGSDGEPCNACHSCIQFIENKSLNIHELDAASHNSADDMRRIVEKIRFHPPSGGKKIIIFDEFHMVSYAGLNVLLKPLEDPPAHVVFILVTTEKNKIIPTIKSRCQIFDFHRISPRDMGNYLADIAKKEGINIEQEAIDLIISDAKGALRDALSTFDVLSTVSKEKIITHRNTLSYLNRLDQKWYEKIAEALLKGCVEEALALNDEIFALGIETKVFLEGWCDFLRKKLLEKSESSMGKKEPILSNAWIFSALGMAQEVAMHYKGTLNEALHMDIMWVRLIEKKGASWPLREPPSLEKKNPQGTPNFASALSSLKKEKELREKKEEKVKHSLTMENVGGKKKTPTISLDLLKKEKKIDISPKNGHNLPLEKASDSLNKKMANGSKQIMQKKAHRLEAYPNLKRLHHALDLDCIR